MFRYFIALLILTTSFAAHAIFLPESQIRYDLLTIGPAQMNEAQFHELIRQAQTSYAEIVQKHGGRLSISGNWSAEKLNAGAAQLLGTWQVQITGGLARRPELTPDGFTLILCHELGHHLGGYSFAQKRFPFEVTWAANEGEADYFATQACARRLWSQDSKNKEFAEAITPFAKNQCDLAWSTENDRALCYRVVAGADSIGKTMAGITGKPIPSFETPDLSVVDRTSDQHPEPQCRIDTSFQGALCTVQFDDTLVPGKSVAGGPYGRQAEEQAARYSCMEKTGYGLRPSCWFKSQL